MLTPTPTPTPKQTQRTTPESDAYVTPACYSTSIGYLLRGMCLSRKSDLLNMTLTVLTGPLNYRTTNHCERITKGTTEWTDTQRISTDPRFLQVYYVLCLYYYIFFRFDFIEEVW